MFLASRKSGVAWKFACPFCQAIKSDNTIICSLDKTTMKNTVMFIEDEEIFHDLIQDIFAKDDISLTCVGNGNEALAYPAHDLYIVDLGLPGMDGLETLAALEQKFGRKVPAFLITGYDAPFNLEGNLESYGIKKILQKPFDIDDLKRLIREHFS